MAQSVWLAAHELPFWATTTMQLEFLPVSRSNLCPVADTAWCPRELLQQGKNHPLSVTSMRIQPWQVSA
jgi:hypothetical protein